MFGFLLPLVIGAAIIVGVAAITVSSPKMFEKLSINVGRRCIPPCLWITALVTTVVVSGFLIGYTSLSPVIAVLFGLVLGLPAGFAMDVITDDANPELKAPDYEAADLVGAMGMVKTPIDKTGIGSVAIEHNGQHLILKARTEGDIVLEAGELVVISKANSRSFVVAAPPPGPPSSE